MRRTPGSLRASFGVGAALAASALVSAAPAYARPFEFGAGLMGTVGGNFLDKPERSNLQPDIYPGYGGMTLGGGLVLDPRFLDGWLGLEVDVIRSTDKGKGDVTINGIKITHTLGQSSWHVPILAKLTIPSAVAPQFFLGPELVFPSAAESTTEPPGLPITATAENYVAITGGAGIEIKLPIPVIDLRIPVGVRVSYTPGVPSGFSERVTPTSLTSAVYHSEWKYAFNLTLGAVLFF
jgi:hypothetical protein